MNKTHDDQWREFNELWAKLSPQDRLLVWDMMRAKVAKRRARTDTGGALGGWPDIGADSPGWPDIGADSPGWPDIGPDSHTTKED